VATLYAQARKGYLSYCETAKLYWNPEQNDAYSKTAFSKLTDLGIENAECKDNGIALIYKNTGHECSFAGNYKCSHTPLLIIASCYNTNGYGSLEGPSVDTYQNTEEMALKKLSEKLKNETFWGKWEQEIKQWRSICE